MARQSVLSRAAVLRGVAGLAVSAGVAQGSILSWINIAGGAASSAGNWSPAQLPTAADTLTFNLNNTYTVTYNGTVAASTAHTYKKGTVTLSLTSPNTVSGNWRVGDVSGDTATATVTTGALTAGSITIGNAAGSVGTVNVNDSDADLFTSGVGDIVVGAGGTGTVNITAGGVVRSADDIILGSAGGDGTINVSGFGTSPLRFSNLQTTAADGDIVVGNSSGTVSTLTVGANGFVNCADDLQVGLVAGASGVVNVSSTVNVGGDLQVGNNSTLTTAGSGTVAALNNGTINVTGAIRLGDTTAGSGTLTCRDGGAINAHSIICDNNGGFLNLLGGITAVDGGVLTAPNNILFLDGPNNVESPLLRLVNGGGCTLSNTVSPFRALTLGSLHHAEVHVESGSSFSVSNGDSVLGESAGSLGILQYSSAATGSFPASRTLTLGKSGSGGMLVGLSSTVSAGAVNLGELATGDGSLTVSGAGAVLTLAGKLSIGGISTNPVGSGDVSILGGGLIDMGSQDVVVWEGGGSLTVGSGSTLSTTGGVQVDGAMTLSGGVVNAGGVSLQPVPNGGTYDFSGVVNGQLVLDRGAQLNVAPAASLSVNGNVSPAILNLSGSVNVGNSTLSCTGPIGPSIGDCTIGALGVVHSIAPIQLASGKTISGDGTINAAITNAGSITATGDGLTFGGIVTGIGQGMSGVRFTFASGGGFTGGGGLNAKVVGLLGSKLVFTTNSSAGDGTTTGFTTDGEIDVTAGNLILSDSNGVGMGSLTTIRNSTTITCASSINLGIAPTLDVLQGQGFINSTVSCAGIIRPGIVGADETGQLTVLGTLALNSGTLKGQLHIDLAGTAAADRDRVTATGPITADGTLKVSLINGFAPANGFSAAVLSSTASVTGTFVTEFLPPRFHVEYGPKDVFVVFCAADFDEDGFISGEDFDQYVAAFEAGDLSADFDGDGFVTGEDFDGFVVAFEAGC